MGFSNKGIDLSVIIPAFNEENNASRMLKNLTRKLDETNLKYEVILVNDGSKDNTLYVLEQLKGSYSNIKIISYDENKGKGYAVRSGILESEGEIVMYIDGDLDISPDIIPEYIEQLKNYDIVIGSKRVSNADVKDSISRKILSKAFSIIVKIGMNLKIKDTQVGLKIGDGKQMRKIFKIMSTNGFAFDVELLTVATLLKLKIKEMPIELNLTRQFSFIHASKMFLDTMKIMYNRRIRNTYQKKLSA
jgi:glycosyltransferase involved in cell wall biosynthesis